MLCTWTPSTLHNTKFLTDINLGFQRRVIFCTDYAETINKCVLFFFFFFGSASEKILKWKFKLCVGTCYYFYDYIVSIVSRKRFIDVHLWFDLGLRSGFFVCDRHKAKLLFLLVVIFLVSYNCTILRRPSTTLVSPTLISLTRHSSVL